MGHFVTGIILKLNVKEIRVFFFGGVTVLEEDLNLCIYKEILLIIMGPVIQILFYLLIYIFYSNGYVSITTFNKVKLVNQILLGFNLLPILPLDGGKILNNVLDIFLPYNLSHVISIIVSIMSVPLIFLFDKKFLAIALVFSLIIKIYNEITSHKYRVNKLMLERKLKHVKHCKNELFVSNNKVKRNVTYYKIVNDECVFDYEYNY